MSASPDDPDADDDEGYFDPAWSRKANSYGTFRRGWETADIDKQIVERGFTEDALTGGGFTFEQLVSHKPDPPDCIALVDGVRTGIEVTELVDREKLEATIEARKRSPTPWLDYRSWTQEDFLSHLRTIIARKSDREWRGDPYERRMLIIHTDEMTLKLKTVGRFLEGQCFASGTFSDVVLVLSYDPETQGHPAFRLTLDPA